MKKLFIYIFPYLEEDYIINEKFIAEFFDKIKACNFIPEDSYGETLSSTLDVYIKNYFEKNDNVEQDICAMASFIIIIFHEFAHYTRIYIFKKTGNPKYTFGYSWAVCREPKCLDQRETPGPSSYFPYKKFGENGVKYSMSFRTCGGSRTI